MELHIAVDGAVSPNPGFGSVAYCIKRKDGKVLRKAGRRLEGDQITNNQAEFEAVLWGLEVVQEYYNKICAYLIFYSNSQLVVNILNREWNIGQGGYTKAAVSALKEVQAFKENLREIEVRWIPRERNTEANDIAEALVRQIHREKQSGWAF